MKQWTAMLVFLVLFCSVGLTARADGQADAASFAESIGEEELMEALPEKVRQELAALGMDRLSPDLVLRQTPDRVVQRIAAQIKEALGQPLSSLAGVLCAVLLAALLEQIGCLSPGGREISEVYTVVSAVAVCGAMAAPVSRCIAETASSLAACADFMLSFLPVFAGVVTACGQPVTASTTQVFLFWVCQLVSRFASSVLVPMAGAYLSVNLASAACPSLGLSGLTGAMKKTVTWALGLCMTLFVGILSMSSLVSAGSDGVSVRAARFLIGSFVPVVGGALSEAYTTARGCLHLLKTTLGAYGMAAAGVLFLPTVCRLGVWSFASGLASAAAQILGLTKIGELLKAVSAVLGILLALVFCFMLLLVVSLTLILLVGQGG